MSTPDYTTTIDAPVETPPNGGGYSTTSVTTSETGMVTKTVEVHMPVDSKTYLTIPTIITFPHS